MLCSHTGKRQRKMCVYSGINPPWQVDSLVVGRLSRAIGLGVPLSGPRCRNPFPLPAGGRVNGLSRCHSTHTLQAETKERSVCPKQERIHPYERAHPAQMTLVFYLLVRKCSRPEARYYVAEGGLKDCLSQNLVYILRDTYCQKGTILGETELIK